MRILLKTYEGDIEQAGNFLKSLHVSEGFSLELFIASDIDTLRKLAPLLRKRTGLTFLPINEDEFLTRAEAENASGYEIQQLVKLRFATLYSDQPYFCADSDITWIRGLRQDDFFDRFGTLKDFLYEDKDLALSSFWRRRYHGAREKYLQNISHFYDIGSFRTAHGMVSLDPDVVLRFFADIELRGWKLHDLISLSPMEFSWYFGFCESNDIKLNAHEPLIKTFHVERQYYDALASGWNVPDMATKYAGYILNSNWAARAGIIQFGQRKLFAHYLKRCIGRA